MGVVRVQIEALTLEILVPFITTCLSPLTTLSCLPRIPLNLLCLLKWIEFLNLPSFTLGLISLMVRTILMGATTPLLLPIPLGLHKQLILLLLESIVKLLHGILVDVGDAELLQVGNAEVGVQHLYLPGRLPIDVYLSFLPHVPLDLHGFALIARVNLLVHLINHL